MVLRYGNRMAVLWTTRRIVAPTQQAPAPRTDIAQRMAASTAVQAAAPPQATASAEQKTTVKVGNVAALYTDKLTGGR
jgi:hypothetical protein